MSAAGAQGYPGPGTTPTTPTTVAPPASTTVPGGVDSGGANNGGSNGGAVQGGALARTGSSNTGPLVGIGAAAVVLGAAFAYGARKPRKA